MTLGLDDHAQWVAWVMGQTLEVTVEAEDAWVAHVNEVANATLYPLAKSWYTGANIPGKPRIFMPYVGGVGAYRMHCDEIAARNYEGFTLTESTP